MRKTLLYLFCLMLTTACYDDATTNGTGAISMITIDRTSVKSEYNIAKNDELVIRPTCSQTIASKSLVYTWEIGDKVWTGEELHYTATALGTFRCRLVVRNEDGSAFLPFTINVNTLYEEGITVLSVKPDGSTVLSFMLHQTEEGVEDCFYNYDCYTFNNPDEEPLAENGSDLAQCNGNLLIACRGGANTSGTIYYIDEKTFVTENIVTAQEYTNFKPMLMGVPWNVYAGTAFPIVCEDGTVYYFSPEEGALTPTAKFPHEYAKSMIVTGRSGGFYDLYMWDRTIGDVCAILNAYGPYYCSTTFHCRLIADDATGGYHLSDTNYFDGSTFEGMVMAQAYFKTDDSQLIVFTRPKGGKLNRTILHYGWWVNGNVLSDNGGPRTVTILPTTALTPETPMVATMRYGVMNYASGNTVKQWVYTTGQYLEKATELVKVGSDKAVITGLVLSTYHDETYIAFYEPDEAEMNGHVWVISTETGDLLRKYDNVCYRPTKMIYKTK